jgi:hypothetical protein
MSRGAVAEVHLDSEPLVQGTVQVGGTATFTDRRQEFRSCGVDPGLSLYCENVMDGSAGTVTGADEHTVTCALSGGSANVWAAGDAYKIYKTSTKDSEISKIWIDRRAGRKVTGKDRLEKGILPEDIDLDEYRDNIFGPGQPERS